MIPWGRGVNVEKVAEELRERGITGRMDAGGYQRHPRSQDPADHGLTAEEQQALAQVVAAHDPTPLPQRVLHDALILIAAGGVVPQWATDMVQAEAEKIRSRNGNGTPGPRRPP